MIMTYERIEATESLGEVLHLVQDARMTQSLNGDAHLTFRVPSPLPPWTMLKASTPEGLQPFYITDVERKKEGYDITAHHVTELLRGMYLPAVKGSFSVVISALQEAMKRSSLPFTLQVEEGVFLSEEMELEAQNVLSALLDGEEALVRQGGFRLFREGFTLHLRRAEGKKTDLLLARKKNLLDATEGINIKKIVTRLYLSCEAPHGQTLHYVSDSPLLSAYPVVMEKALALSSEEAESLEDLKEYASRFWRKGLDQPEERLEVQPATLQGKTIRLGDSALLYYEAEDLYRDIDLLSYEYDPMEERFLRLHFGHPPQTLERVLKKQIQEESLPLRKALHRVDRKTFENSEHLARQLEHLQSQMGQLQAHAQRMDQQEKDIHNLGVKLELAEGNYTAKINQTAQEIYSECREIRKMAGRDKQELSSRLSQTAEEITAQVSDVQRGVNSNYQQISNIKIRASGIETKVTALQQTDRQLQSDLSRVEQTARSITSTVQTVQTHLNQTKTDLSEIKQTATSIRSRVSSTESDIQGLKNSESEFRQTARSFDYRIKSAGLWTTVMSIQSGGVYFNRNLYARNNNVYANRVEAQVVHANYRTGGKI